MTTLPNDPVPKEAGIGTIETTCRAEAELHGHRARAGRVRRDGQPAVLVHAAGRHLESVTGPGALGGVGPGEAGAAVLADGTGI